MDKVGRWTDESFLPERGLTLSPAVDANLRDRIRSLLISRNQKHPPKTPCSSPDYNYHHHDSLENQNYRLSLHLKSFRFPPGEAQAQRTRLANRSSDMGATRFDGPAGYIGDIHEPLSARRPGHSTMQTDRKLSGDWQWSTPTSGLNQRAHGDVLGREASSPSPFNRRKSSASRKPTDSRIPRFHLRTVAPANDVNKILRPGPLHVPGSYRSEVDSRKDSDPNSISPPLKDTLEDHEDGILAVPYHTGLSNEHLHQAAIDALKGAVKHDHKASQPAIDVQSTPSRETIKPTASVTQAQGLPQESATGHFLPSQAEEPTSSITDDSSNKPNDHFDAPDFVVGDDHDSNGASSDKISHDNNYSLPLSGRQISELLAELPPMTQRKCIEVQAPLETPKIRASNMKSSPGLSFIPLELTRDQIDDTASLAAVPLPKDTEVTRPEAIEADDQATAALMPFTRPSSQATRRFSSVSRAMSLISELSSRSGVKTSSLRSFTKYMKVDSPPNLTRRPSSHSRRTARATSQVDDDQQNLLGPTNYEMGSQSYQSQQSHSEGFTRVITDLESVFNEALSIAGQTGSKGKAPALSYPAQRKGHKREGSDASLGSVDSLSSISGGTDEEQTHSFLPCHKFDKEKQGAGIEEPKIGLEYHAKKEAGYPTQRSMQPRPALMMSKSNDGQAELNRQGTRRDFGHLPRTSSKALIPVQGPLDYKSSKSSDRPIVRVLPQPSKLRLEVESPPPVPQIPSSSKPPAKEQHAYHVRHHGDPEDKATRKKIRDYLDSHQRPPIETRLSSRRLKGRVITGRIPDREELNLPDERSGDDDDDDGEREDECECVPYVADFETSGLRYHPVFQEAISSDPPHAPRRAPRRFEPPNLAPLYSDGQKQEASRRNDEAPPETNTYSLEGRHHFSIREPRGFSLSRSHRRSPIARDWSVSRKRYTATVVCVTTAFMGLIIGIYAGEVPAIQYAIADEHHYTILGNVLFYIGLAITTALFYPLPLLHGRKPYTLAALAILLPLQFPQALAINMNRSPYVATYRVGLLVPRVFAGIVMGFANINFITTLLDLYGASLQSGNPHQETVNENDVRRHGGGMGVWLSIWTWCAIGSIGLGFLIGAGIISGLDVSWGFWILIILNAAVLVLNIITPEVRRSAYRRSMAEVREGGDVSRRVARGEIKMHLESTGPIWWWEEVIAGHVLAIRMLLQPGFTVLAFYQGWIYGQVVLLIVASHVRSNCRLSF